MNSQSRLVMMGFALCAASTGADAQASAHRANALAGCYALTVGEWSRPLNNDPYHAIPPLVYLDTIAGYQSGGGVLQPSIRYPYGHDMITTPRWEILRDTLQLVWSNGFSPTIVRLVPTRGHLEGYAEARSDAIPPGKPDWPHAKVIAKRVSCDDVTWQSGRIKLIEGGKPESAGRRTAYQFNNEPPIIRVADGKGGPPLTYHGRPISPHQIVSIVALTWKEARRRFNDSTLDAAFIIHVR